MDCRIKQRDGFEGKIGELVSMLDYSRDVLLSDIKGLSQSDLDFIAYEGANSIGALLKHIASVEFVHQLITHEDRDLNEKEFSEWKTALFLGPEASHEIRNQPLDYYLNLLNATREKTLSILSSKNEEWLFEEGKWDNGVAHNKYWFWYHVMEDEVNHRGQIRVIKKMLLHKKES
ncbi:DinB family protein [Jeotgalibacillus haloalkalitolerans]|uniref:DinB family protein n=1 Tax=Jeotgalibacillus haloalkalitolerans TaxID=3104292 RepID=A0ABU5KNN0_9BACL|nr:DinB family protein [Jeotgalibacillus sp. HH7-29]MDZ5712754.1 DinB family protein [Jeotgalibacillus sp. HH7-29]